MDWLGLGGLVLGIAAVVIGNMVEGGHLASLLNLPAAIIVFGGTLAAVLVQTPFNTLLTASMRGWWLIFPPRYDLHDLIDTLCQWGAAARREGFLGLENIAKVEPMPLAKKGLHLLADGQSSEAIRNSLELDMYKQEDAGLEAAHVYESLGGYAPTIGILGAVLGLIQVMGNLQDPAAIGPGIATAFVATIYGVGSANLIFLPIASRIKHIVKKEYQYNELIVEGLVAISEGEHPNSIRHRYEIVNSR
ncbi:flagellar motor protein [Bermanella marisrubri]|uniref:Flagellar motor protein n=1 Tax=Bermanella marisrubri TaxID=207949 RepID=Q1N2U0_9GAMM|nr:flagellar motor protein [Bermanella marisrubri]EAT12579.1 flagellar motor protein [Oceanobacter sp. RED65] [Bermanella marisrubri]QIZ84865.1 flagellar motor protein [Bermanella marisrubri]